MRCERRRRRLPAAKKSMSRSCDTRAGAIATASSYRAVGKSFVDLEAGIFHRLAIGKRAGTKRQTPVPLPTPLLAHLWRSIG
jgi:hypothetical protein